jgi:hypothetical protein
LFEFFMENLYTGAAIDAYEAGPHDGSTADFIVERPTIGSLRSLSNFGTMTYNKALSDGVGISNDSPVKINMYTNRTLAAPSSLSGTYSSFTDAYHYCN